MRRTAEARTISARSGRAPQRGKSGKWEPDGRARSYRIEVNYHLYAMGRGCHGEVRYWRPHIEAGGATSNYKGLVRPAWASRQASALVPCEHRLVKEDLERLSDDYEKAESAFLDAVRTKVARGSLAAAARTAADAASLFNSEAYRCFHSGTESAWMPLDHLTERTEVLAELWLDIATAYES